MGKSTSSNALERVQDWYVGDVDLSDPYPMFAELRETCPIAHSDRCGGFYLVTDYQNQHSVLKDPGPSQVTFCGFPPSKTQRESKSLDRSPRRTSRPTTLPSARFLRLPWLPAWRNQSGSGVGTS